MHTNPNHSHGSARRYDVLLFLVAMMALLCSSASVLHAASPNVVITPAAGYTITWNGINGAFSGAAPPDNIALATHGTVPFTSSDLGPLLGIPFHRAVNLNDGLYGNSHSWISQGGCCGGSDADPFAGLRFAASVNIASIAWSRDNTPTPPYPDRTVGTYTLQFTTVAGPDGSTPFTGDAATGWENIGTVQYLGNDANFISYQRHRFDIAQAGSPIAASGLRIKVSDPGMDLDEIEVNPPADPVPPGPVGLNPAAGYSITWNGNDGLFNNPAAGAAPPDNRALASHGTTPFTSSDYGPFLGIPFHRAVNLNDGLYGNAHSWISHDGADADPFAGLNFNGTVTITNLAWSRDNGDDGEGVFTDRTLGLYTIQVTLTAVPNAATPDTGDASTGWETVGTIEYRFSQPPAFTPYLRHAFDVSSGGAGITATGLRIKVPNSSIDLDEIEVYVVPPVILDTNTVSILTSSGSPTSPGVNVDFTTTVGSPGGTPNTGTVQIRTNGTAFGSPVAVNGSGVAVLSTTTLPEGSYSVTAVYSGGGIFLGSTSAPITQVVSGPVGLAPAPGYGITWNGNDGLFNNPAAGAAPPDNRALASHGTTPFTSSDLGPLLGIPFHRAVNLNDGLYGNSRSWISQGGCCGGSDADPFAGLNFNGTVTITNLAWSRDNGDNGEGVFTDRALGLYTIQVTLTAVPNAATPDTGDASTGWETVGTIEYRRSEPPTFTPYLRHAFGVSSGGAGITATGLRIKVPNSSTDLDEIEVYVVQPSIHLTIGRTNSTKVLLTWDSVIGNQYQVESIATVDAPAIAWTSVGGPLTANGASMSLSDTIAPNLQRYYRVRQLVP